MFRDVPECSGMFQHGPECSVFRVLSTANIDTTKAALYHISEDIVSVSLDKFEHSELSPSL